jgi:hypothetical protein
MSETPLKRAKRVMPADFSRVSLLARRLRVGRENCVVSQPKQ